VVTGRWIFPGQAITDLQWKDGHLQVVASRVFDFDPSAPRTPPVNQMHADVSRIEGLRSLARSRFVKPSDAEKMLPELENAVRRDPFSPWLRIAQGRLYLALGREESTRAFDEGIRMGSAHFSELLDIANRLGEYSQHAAARVAFERGYAEFWRQGQDPRLVSALLVPRLVTASPAVQVELTDRAYATGPWIDGAAKAWDLYGNFLARNGDTRKAALWLERAKDARTNGLLVSGDTHYNVALSASLLTSTSLAAAVLYIFVLYFRYRLPRQARRAAERAAGVSRPGLCNLEYWRRSERVAFLSIIAIAWLAEGVAGSALRASAHRSFGYFFEMRDGTLFSSNTIDSLESRVVPSPERDLLLAIAYQREGQQERAKKLYESVPQFAEGWNNLGVLLKNSGDAEGGRRAFEEALQRRPDFPEAEWNLGKPARGEWVTRHQQYVPDKPMMTVPTRAQVLRTYGIRENTIEWVTALKGPLGQDDEVNNFFRPSGRLRAGVLIFLTAGALVLIFIRPREVLLAPSKYQVFLELLFPGTARNWGALGGILLGAACYFSFALWPAAWARPYSYANFGTNFRRFPLPADITGSAVSEFLSPIPPFWWIVGLMTLNAAVVLFWKWRRK
jgi:tetratricopeptide (TPR) repeat protein